MSVMLTIPSYATALLILLRVDGVSHNLGDAVVLKPSHREAFPLTLPWSLELFGPVAERFVTKHPALTSGDLRPAIAARVFDALRTILLSARLGQPRFALTSIDRVEVRPGHVRLVGSCAPILSTTSRPSMLTV